ncbi:hypothetical protein [Actinomyces trachealis]|uniref:hypothetical protein n=1 Tax=Actinomyces trachealis TaxID=2763540 RepID=UPI00189289C2|nr:hypothetical protein [Actinomyces trachealis]
MLMSQLGVSVSPFSSESSPPVRYETWESYFCPETYDPSSGQGTLRNLYDERDARALARLEYVAEQTCFTSTSVR